MTVAMGNLNIREDDDRIEDLEAEADQHGYDSLSAYIRSIIRNRDQTIPGVAGRVDQHETRLRGLEELVDTQREQIEALEAEVEALRDKVGEK